MTSKKLFWANRLENHRRRVSVWMLAALVQILAYPSILIMYYSRIQSRYSAGVYANETVFRKQMWRATCDALCFSEFGLVAAGVLAFLIGLQGFSFLHSKKKEDMYYSVPVSMTNRFKMVYGNGLAIYFATAAIAYVLSLLLAVFQGAIDGILLGRSLISFVYCGLFFLAMYSLVTLAVMLTGNMLFSMIGSVILLIYLTVWTEALNSLKYSFFNRATRIFEFCAANPLKSCGSLLQMVANLQVAYVTDLLELMKVILPYMAVFAAEAAIFTFIAYKLYMKRPTEAAGKAVAFAASRPILKILLVIPATLVAGITAYNLSERNVYLMTAVFVIAAFIIGAFLEAIFEEDIRACFKHMAPTVVALAIVLSIFGIYKFDVFGYDRYVPKEEELESFAVFDNVYGIQNDHWIYTDGDSKRIAEEEYLLNHLYLKDAGAICALANRGLGTPLEEFDDATNVHEVSVLYRLKSGRLVSRLVTVDFSDETAWPFLERIYGTEEYITGYYQAANYEDIEGDSIKNATYINGKGSTNLNIKSAKTLCEAWLKDIKHTKFTEYLNGRKPIGFVELNFKSYSWLTFYVYENFENTISYLASLGADTQGEIKAEDVRMIRVINYNDKAYDEYYYDDSVAIEEGVYEDFTREIDYEEPEQIQEILEASFPSALQDGFVNATLDNQYYIKILLNNNEAVNFDTGMSLDYLFYKDRVPGFVTEDTTYK